MSFHISMSFSKRTCRVATIKKIPCLKQGFLFNVLFNQLNHFWYRTRQCGQKPRSSPVNILLSYAVHTTCFLLIKKIRHLNPCINQSPGCFISDMSSPKWPEGKPKFQCNGYIVKLGNENLSPLGTKAYKMQRTKSQGQKENLFVSWGKSVQQHS